MITHSACACTTLEHEPACVWHRPAGRGSFWNGEGRLEPGAVHFTNNDGTLQGRPYVRERVRRRLARSGRMYSLADRKRALEATVDSDAWLAPKSGCLVAYVVREAMSWLYVNGTVLPYVPRSVPNAG